MASTLMESSDDDPEALRFPPAIKETEKDSSESPMDWSPRKKWMNVLSISSLTLISPLGSSMFAPSTSQVMTEFHSSNVDLESFSVSILVLGYAFGPLIHAPMSELYGRLTLYHINSVLFILCNVAGALSVNLPMVIVFRLLTGIIGSCPLAVGPASIADMFQQDERGRAIAIWNLPILLGPSTGPLIGSYLSSAMGWRWDFWILAILMGAFFIVSLFCLSESHAPTLARREARKNRRRCEESGTPIVIETTPSTESARATFFNAIVRPTKFLVLSPIVFSLSLCAAVTYGFIYLVFTTMSSVFIERYGMSHANVGLTYIPYGLGNIIGDVLLGLLSDKLMLKMASNKEMKPEYRLPPLLPGSMFVPIGLMIYGWSLDYNIHWIVPLIGQLIFGMGVIFVFVPISTYLVDAFTEHAASATAANTVFRSLGGGLLPLCGGKMYAALGDGWGNCLLSFIGFAFVPVMWLVYRYGEYLREHFPVRLE